MKKKSEFSLAAVALALMGAFSPNAGAVMMIEDDTFLSDADYPEEALIVTNNAQLIAERITAGSVSVGSAGIGGRASLRDSTFNSLRATTGSLMDATNLNLRQVVLSDGARVVIDDSAISEIFRVTNDAVVFGKNLQINDLAVTTGGEASFNDVTISGELEVYAGGRLSLTNVKKTDDVVEIKFSGAGGSRLTISDSILTATIVNSGLVGSGKGFIDLNNTELSAPEGFKEVLLVSSHDNVTFQAASSSVYGDIRTEKDGVADVWLAENSVLVGKMTKVNKLDITSKETLFAMTSDSDAASLNMGNQEIRIGGKVKLSGNTAGDENFYTLTAGNLTGSGEFIMRTDVANHLADLLHVTGDATGNHTLYVTNTGNEVGTHGQLLPLVTIGSGDASFGLSGGKVDVGAWQYALVRVGNTWGLMRPGDGVIVTPILPEGPDNPGEPGNPEVPGNPGEPDGPTTTPTTDAVLSLASALKEMYFGELRSLKARDSRVNSGLDDGVWGSYTNNHMNVQGAWSSAYKLNQNGFLLGADHQFSFDAGKLTTGMFVSNSTGSVKHARGGKSKIETWGTGLYADYDFSNGWYASAVAKANRFETSLSAKMTDGAGVSGSWTTWGYGVGAEVGRKIVMQNGLAVTPYASLNGYQNEDETARLSNGLKADFGNSRSLRGEAGVRAEKTFSTGKTAVTPYVSAAVAQEFARSSDVRINDTWNFRNDFTGTGVNAAAGVAVNVTDNVNVWLQAATGKADKTQMPMQASAGIAFNF